MAPLKIPKVVKTPAKDIRTFFGNAGSSQTDSSQKRNSAKVFAKAEPIQISDDDNAGPSKATPRSSRSKGVSKEARAPLTKSDRIMVAASDDDSDNLLSSKKAQPSRDLKRKKAAVIISSDDEDDEDTHSPPPKKKIVAASSTSKHFSSTSDVIPKLKQTTRATGKGKQPAKRIFKDDDYEMSLEESEAEDNENDYVEDVDVASKKGKTTKTKKEITNQTRAKAETKTKTISPDPPPKKETAQQAPAKPKVVRKEEDAKMEEPIEPKAFNWAAAKAAKMRGPAAPGSKEVPEPKSPDCLAGLSFVFTGELSSFSRDEAVDLAKRFGGRVVGQPSSKTSYVVLGNDAGPSKLAAIKKHNLQTLSEDEFLNLIATREGPSSNGDEKTRKKMEKEQEAIRQAARELEMRERKAAKESAKASGSSKQADLSSQLWTTKYAPQSIKEICGNKGQVEKLQQWLHDWPDSLKAGFKKPGKNGMNIFRAVMITGNPGIGKTTSAHLCAELEGFTPIELNASDARSKKLVENSTNIDNTSLSGWLGGNATTNAVGVTITDKSCLIMDEVDGMSAGDRGGVGALNALIKKSKIPIICIANDRTAQKLKPLLSTTFNLPFRKPDAVAVRSRMMTIAFKEKMKIPANVIDQLITGAQSDIRQVLNMLSTWRLSSDAMTFDESKNLVKINQKHTILTPFDVTHQMLGPYMFSQTSRETLGDKMELYFHDHAFVPLFIQENYLKTQPARVKNLDGPPKILKQLELMDRAASSISDGDLVDGLIHGPEQHWSLMPLHAVCSTVRPASFLYGAGGGYGGPNAMTFPQWLGQNSKQGKLSRQLGDVQIRMRLKVSGDRNEVRQSYIPALFPHIIKPLTDEGASAVEGIIETMDEYFLSKEDWDTIVELGVDQQRDETVLKKISTATKTSLTRKYNASEHPIPFHKAQDLGKIPKKLAGGAVPDLEEAFDLEDDIPGEPSDDEKTSKDEDITKDKLIQATKSKGKGKASVTKGKGKK